MWPLAPQGYGFCGAGPRSVVGRPSLRRRRGVLLPPLAGAHATPRPPLPMLSFPSFYTTDFDEVDEIFNLEKNPDLPMEELTAMLEEFRRCEGLTSSLPRAPEQPWSSRGTWSSCQRVQAADAAGQPVRAQPAAADVLRGGGSRRAVDRPARRRSQRLTSRTCSSPPCLCPLPPPPPPQRLQPEALCAQRGLC